jgi:integrase
MKGSVFKRGKTYSIDVKLQKDENNEWLRVRKGGFRTKKEAEAYLAEIISKSNKGEYAEYENMTVKSFLTLWLDQYCKNNLKLSTYANRKNLVESRIMPVLGKCKIEDLKPIHFTRFYNDLHEKNYSPVYIHAIHTCLKTAFKHALKWQISSRFMMDNVDAPKYGKKKQLNTWTLQEASNFLKFTESIVYEYCHIAYVLAIFTGMRRGEILGLRWSDIDLNRKILQVVQTVYKPFNQQPQIQTPKTAGSMRSISLSDNVIDELKIHKKKQNELRLRFVTAYEDNNLVCPKPDGRPMDPRALIHHFEKSIKKVGVKKIRFHDLRHTHATIMLQLGEHPKVVSERLGHSNVNITLNTYSHVLPNMQEDAARKLYEAYKNIGN